VNFLVDAQLPPGLARWLSNLGHSAQHVNDVGLAGAEDSVIWNHALGVDVIIVTKDEDFAERTARTAVGPVIVWLRSETLRTVRFSNGWNRVGLLSFNSCLTTIDLIEVR
jgi:predicted nuclease of predicted toxin-antitoxin system